jgi:hypothetical protein
MEARYPIMAILVTALIAFLVVVAFRAWSSRANSQEARFSAPAEWLEHPSGSRQWTRVQYVATSVLNDPLNRITAHGMGPRGYAKVTASTDGVLIERNGETPIGIRADQISGVSRTTAAIDRTVETDGLIQIDWAQDGFGLSTFLRATKNDDRAQLFELLNQIVTKETSNG